MVTSHWLADEVLSIAVPISAGAGLKVSIAIFVALLC
jgi:hypothetical protein